MELDIFKYEGQQVRTIHTESGEPGFVATDICRVLEVRNTSDALSSLDDDEKGIGTTDTLGGPQQLAYITESGLYSLVLRSRKPQAKPFKRWVTHEVLPSIRKTGGYGSAPAIEVPRTLPEALRAYAREVEAREAMESYARELEPKGEAYDAFISGDGTYSVGNVAKMCGLSQNKLYARLRSEGVMIAKGAMRNTPYQKYMHHFAVKAYDYTRQDGTVGTSYTTRVQPTGVDFIRRRFGLVVQDEITV